VLKKSITYHDLDGKELAEDFYFNLTKAEIAKMELVEPGGLAKKLQGILAEEDRRKILDTFEMIIKQTVGRRSEDGKRFIKTPEITNEFMQTEAYSVLFMEMVTDAEAAAAFIVGVVPSDVSKIVTDKINSGVIQLPSEETSKKEFIRTITDPDEHLRPRPTPSKTIQDYTPEEFFAMPLEEVEKLLSENKGNVPKHLLVSAMIKRVSE